MSGDFAKKIPKEIELSPDLKSRAKGYIEIMYFGVTYYIPVTKELQKVFNIKKIKGQLSFENYKKGRYIRKCLQDIIAGVYLQIRDTIGAELHQQLSRKIEEGFGNLFSNYLEKHIEDSLNIKLLEHKGEK